MEGLSYCPHQVLAWMHLVLECSQEAAGWSPLFQHLLVPGRACLTPHCTHGIRLEELLLVANERWGIN